MRNEEQQAASEKMTITPVQAFCPRRGANQKKVGLMKGGKGSININSIRQIRVFKNLFKNVVGNVHNDFPLNNICMVFISFDQRSQRGILEMQRHS